MLLPPPPLDVVVVVGTAAAAAAPELVLLAMGVDDTAAAAGGGGLLLGVLVRAGRFLLRRLLLPVLLAEGGVMGVAGCLPSPSLLSPIVEKRSERAATPWGRGAWKATTTVGARKRNATENFMVANEQ